MLEKINRYAHGFVAVPVILACKQKGLFEFLQHQGSLTLEQIIERLGANSGHLQVALRMMRSLNWISRNEAGQYSLTDEAQLHKKILEDILDLYRLPIESYLKGEQQQDLLKNWIERSSQRWNVEDPMIADFLDGILAIPILLALHKYSQLVEDEGGSLFSQLSDPVREELCQLFASLGWAHQKEGHCGLTDVGRFIADRALITGTTASYTPMLSRMPELLFGDCQAVFSRDASGHETHVDRTLNVVASGFQHEKYFADVENIILSIFNRLPYEEQPNYIVDMGCGDGTLLKRVYETIRSKSARGKVLDLYPLRAIGVDYNEASITATARTLAGIPHLVLKGDIGDPEEMVASLRERGINDPENILHIRSFLDHDRPFICPQNLEKAQARTHLSYENVSVDVQGNLIPPHVAVQSLVEHLERWTRIVTKHELIILEVHSLEARIVNKFLDKSENLHFDAYQAFSMQHLVEADVFLMAAAEVGLFPKFEFSKRYPKTFPFTRITLNCFEKRLYTIRHPNLSDLPALVNLEAKCWPEHLRASADEIRQRIERFPNGHCVVEMDGQLVGVVYSQRISSADILKNITYAQVPSLHVPHGAVIQLLGINVLPEMQDKGLGDRLREFVLQLCALKGGIERVVGVTRCKNYVSQTHIPIEEYIHQRNDSGQRSDPILRFHEEGGATLRAIIQNYRPEDRDNLGNGILIEYDIHSRQPKHSLAAVTEESWRDRKSVELKENETFDELVKDCIRFVIGDERRAAFAPKRPLMEMGLDSLELLELKTILSQRLGVELEPTFFFQYSTPEAIARYLDKSMSTTGTNIEESVSAIPSAPQKVEGKHSYEPPEVTAFDEDLVAIIGMACRFPGANNIEEYWSLLHSGIDAISEVPPTRWDIKQYYKSGQLQPGTISTKYGGFLEHFDQFDANFFRIAPREATHTDPQQRILLETCWSALENAGINPETLAGTPTGVFVGIFSHDYELLQVKQYDPKDYEAYFATGNSASIAAGRLSYFFGFTGAAISVDTACSSSLVAVHLASQSLRNGECNIALASGVNLLLSPELSITFSSAGMLSPDGRCKTFDASANGYVRSEGCGVVVLKRLSHAIADNDNILAVIRGSAINQDGASNGLTAPNRLSQEAVIHKALSVAGVSPSEISYLEAHGTATSLGDPVEVKALEAVYGQDRSPEQPLIIGSVKTNIGHTEAAAGMAGLIKVVLSMQNNFIPPHLHFKEVNPHITLDRIPAIIPASGMEWQKSASGLPRLAGISSFGFSGTNAHVILQQAPVLAPAAAKVERSCHVLTLSAKTEKALLELLQAYQAYLELNSEISLADVCFTTNAGRSHFEYRLAVVAESNLQLRDELTAFATGQETFRLVSGRVNSTKAPLIAFLFTGQGSQYIGMGRQLYELSPTFRQTLDRCDSIVRPYLDEPLLNVLYPEPGKTSPINETAYTQPALFALEYALHQLWQSWGIKPAAVMGHSVGEYVAATVAGVFSLEDGLKLIAARGRLMQALPQNGEMVAALASERQVAPVIEPYLHEVAIAALNGPDSVVISGKRETIRLVVAQLEAMEIKTTPLQVSHAFHSPLIEPMLEEFARVASEITYSPPKINLISNVTGELAEAEVTTPEYWCRHVRCSVRFAAGMEALYRAGYEVFVECGSKPILLGMGRKCLPEGVGRWLPSLRPGQEDWQQILQSLAQLYVEGVQVDWSGFDGDYARRRLQLPTYPFQRSRYWFEMVQDLPTQEKPEVSLLWETVVAASSYQAQQGPFDLELHTYQAKLESYDSLTTAYIISALQNLGIYRQAGERHSVERLLPQFKILPTYRKLLSRWLERLVREGILQQKEQVFVNQKPLPKALVDSCLHQARERSTNAPQLIDFIQRCGENLADVLVGQVHPLELIFPGGSSEITNYLYQQSPEARYFNGIARSVMEAVVRNQPQAKSLRILEVGAGTAGTTGSLLPILPKERTSYWFTDVSELFLEKAKQKFKTYPFVRYSLLDIEQNPQNQGYPLHSFDVVVAVNVLHATRNIEETLENVRSLLAPGGLLLIVEVTNPPCWLDITFGLSEGWHRFDDNRRGNNPLLSQAQWESVLRDCGFEQVLALPSFESPTEILGQNVLVAQSGLLTKDSTDSYLTWAPPNQELGVTEIEESPRSDRYEAMKPSNLQQSWESRLHEKVASILGISISKLNIDTSLTNLGFDSLMAVELTNWIAKEVGVNIPVVSFPAGANITQLTNRVREAIDCAATKAPTEYQPYPCLIPLQPQGSKPPFFCVHPIAGVVFPYYELSSLLDKDQPFYGLQSYGLAGEGEPLTRIEDMAAHYIKAMRAVQPHGPYFLGGWSFGAYVAFEMAQQLQQDGQNVALLAILDMPRLSGNKTGNLLMLFKIFISVSLRYIWPYVYDYFYLATTANLPKKTSGKEVWTFDRLSSLLKPTAVAKVVLQESKFFQLQQPILRHLLPAMWANSKALVNYVPKVYPDKITLFQSSRPLVASQQDRFWGWKDLSLKGVEICQISGHHLNCLRMPHVKVVAEQLANCIQLSK